MRIKTLFSCITKAIVSVVSLVSHPIVINIYKYLLRTLLELETKYSLNHNYKKLTLLFNTIFFINNTII